MFLLHFHMTIFAIFLLPPSVDSLQRTMSPVRLQQWISTMRLPCLIEDSDIDDGFEFEIVTGSTEKITKYNDVINEEKGGGKNVAIISSLLAVFAFGYNNLIQPSSSLVLLHAMERDSIPLQTALCNEKPTMIEFYADWCQSCKEMAPVMRSMELQYANRVNFITVNGVDQKNYDLVRKFKVDGIPHVAFLGSDHELKTSLVGAVPKGIMKDEIEALVSGLDLPYLGSSDPGTKVPFENIPKICELDSTKGGLTAAKKSSLPVISTDTGSRSISPPRQEVASLSSAPTSTSSVFISEELRDLMKTQSVRDILDGKRF